MDKVELKEVKETWRRTVLNDLLEKARDAHRALQSWGRMALLNPAWHMHDPAYNAVSRIKYAAYNLGELLLMDADRIRNALRGDDEVARELAREVVKWAWRVHRLAIEWGLVVNEEAVALLKKLRREV